MGIITTNTVSGQIANFESDRAAAIRSLKVYFSPKQSGTGDPSPTNVRPISGWNGINLNFSGKSICQFKADSITRGQGVVYNGYSGWCDNYIIPDRNVKYTYSVYIDNTNGEMDANAAMWMRNADDTAYVDGTAIGGNKIAVGSSGWSSLTFNPISKQNTYIIIPGLYFKGNTVCSSPMLEIGDTASTYEPYDSNTYQVEFPDNQTIYGGYVDLISGEVWKTHNLLHFIPSYIQAVIEGIYSPYYAISATIGNAVVQNSIISDKLVGNSNPNEFEAFISSEPRLIIGVPSTLNTLSAVRSWMEDIGGFDVVYRLKNPQLVTTLSPTALTTIIGTNNFWSNADSVEVTYDVYLPDSIEQHRRRVLLETPHREYAIDNFKTDMRSYLKECRTYFSPVQEDGLVSPTSPKAISGWDEINIGIGGEKNICPPISEWVSGYLTSDGIISSASSTRKEMTSPFIPINGMTKYVFSYNLTGTIPSGERYWAAVSMYDSKKKHIQRNSRHSDTNLPFTNIQYDNVAYIRVSFRTFGIVDYVQVEEGETPTTFDQNGEIYAITFPQTIYGGYVDLINGEIVKEWEYYDAKNINWSATSQVSRGVFLGNIPPRDQSISDGNIICDSYKTADHSTSITVVDDLTIKGHANTSYPSNLYIRDQRYTTVEDFKANLNAHFVYKLATPIHYPITPEQIRPIKGENNFWSDANGRIEVVYYNRRSDGIRPIDGYAYVTSDGYLIATDNVNVFGEEAI